uniref:Uncharacterized protein n=1 Tax=Nelumbo nucifera TaxID=4432 RepID=A0A822ZAQ5_NELNU|nr:TPA_asm: hypothetical protein HUJ06_000422 [Nelumbo nucifera]
MACWATEKKQFIDGILVHREEKTLLGACVAHSEPLDGSHKCFHKKISLAI